MYRAALDAAGDAVFIINVDGKVLYANAYAETLFGFSIKEFLRQYLQKLLVP